MNLYRVEPAGPAAVDTCGMRIPRGGITLPLDEATVGLLEGDARVTVTPAEPPTAPPPASRKSRRRS